MDNKFVDLIVILWNR